MRRILYTIGFSLVLGSSFSCKASSGEDPLVALLSSPPVVSSVTPQIGSPAQNNLNAIFPATEVVIKGENFGIDPVVRFNDVVAGISANLGTELHTRVPDGAYSGFITVSKSGGSCLPNSKEGSNCAGTEYFIDCYAITNKQYGSEIEIKQGQSLSVEFGAIETKAFHTDTLLGSRNLIIGCQSVVTVRVFSRSCQATDYVLQNDPIIPFPAGVATQFYITANSATCSLVL
ncbi:hypothetical protein ND861_01535 [Leptospira sp. 2 VSF19]|uniref:IPT/TIG domain protein n=1 Tax=Leptospira soteropolitanensis TaxID=2950025 RepID=A0AAW5VCP4_9LEPT|nr:hypothetical protein [Leptospira soteropolitanensis]MCW7491328.1 hypothetical protein [Leptospira soteropolitanensis]MCW7498913.1 hypothetical protein [Leptospira soteropolitanensis]MCW7521495.1 hypothetical protein [Leptospira soteropolitanensis]MCW7525016.1 hypothetical protein [Leptospira soteropolitanensis]MCW7528884.1 hypothetical protein [Leptospira soteropolitanensis]